MAGVDPKKVRFLNTIRCHPDKNRDPYAGEIKACSKWLDMELRLIDPDLILAVGAVAVQTLVPEVTSLKALHGQVYERNGIPTVVLYHPAGVDRAVPRQVLEADYKNVQRRLKQYKKPDIGTVTRTLVKDRQGIAEVIERLTYTMPLRARLGFDIETNETEHSRLVMKAPDPLTNELAGMAFAFEGDSEGDFDTFYIPTTDHPDGLVDLGDLLPDRYMKTWDDLRRYLTRHVWNTLGWLMIHNAKFEFMSLDKYLPAGVKNRLPSLRYPRV